MPLDAVQREPGPDLIAGVQVPPGGGDALGHGYQQAWPARSRRALSSRQ